jgi:hypothetical protein
VENNRKPEIANLKLRSDFFRREITPISHCALIAKTQDTSFARLPEAIANYRERAKILLTMRFDSGRSGQHEVCSSVYSCFPCACVASIGGFATAFSGHALTMRDLNTAAAFDPKIGRR